MAAAANQKNAKVNVLRGGAPAKDEPKEMETEFRDESIAIAQTLRRHAESTGRSATKFALAWLWANRIVTSVIGTYFVRLGSDNKIMKALYKGLIVTGILSAIARASYPSLMRLQSQYSNRDGGATL